MGNSVFPNSQQLPIQGWPITRTPIWRTRKMQSIAGFETVISDFQYPLWQWELTYSALRQAFNNNEIYQEFAILIGFFNQRNGGFDSFQYLDNQDNLVLNQEIGIANGISSLFPLVRAFGGFVEPVYAPNLLGLVPYVNASTPSLPYGMRVYLNGIDQGPFNNSGSPVFSSGGNPGVWSVIPWPGATIAGIPFNPGLLNFNTVPAAGTVVSASFQYYWPCRFSVDKCDFEQEVSGLWSVKKLNFQSIKVGPIG